MPTKTYKFRLTGLPFQLILILVALTIALIGFYVGIYVFLLGGIITVIEQVKAPEIDKFALAWAIIKIVFFELPTSIGVFGTILTVFSFIELFKRN